MPVSEATLSTSPALPQAQVGIGWSSARIPSSAIRTCPSSPACPDAPRTTRPASITPPPSPVPTMAAIDDAVPARSPKCTWWA